MKRDNTDLENYFKDHLGGAEVAYVPNFGNAGDALIAMGTFEFFKKIGVNYKIRRDWRNLRNQDVAYAGGGALVGRYKRSEMVFRGLLENGNRVVVLPHTITCIDPQVLSRWGHNLSIFCRERTTYDYLRSCPEIGGLELAHDMAFYLADSVKQLAAQNWCAKAIAAVSGGSLKDRARTAIRLPKALFVRRRVKCGSLPLQTLNCFREDVERGAFSAPPDNLDISELFSFGTETLGGIRFSALGLLSALAGFERIRTDRLHCCIGGLLLGKRVEFFANNYHKNRSVFEHSIAGHDTLVEWMGSQGSPERTCGPVAAGASLGTVRAWETTDSSNA